MIQKFLFCLIFLCGSVFSAMAFADGEATPTPPAQKPIHYDWASGADGWGYCFAYDDCGHVLNGGHSVPNSFCEQTNPSTYVWGRATNGWGYCFQTSPYGQILNQGHSVQNLFCEALSPSYYGWGHGIDGYIYCYQFTPNGYVMNDGHAVPADKCMGTAKK